MRELSNTSHLNGHTIEFHSKTIKWLNYFSSRRNSKSHNNMQIFILLLLLLLLFIILINKFLKKKEPQNSVKVCDHFFRDF